MLFVGLAVVSLMLSLAAAAGAVFFFRRGLGGDRTGGLAAVVIAPIFFCACIAAVLRARSCRRPMSQSTLKRVRCILVGAAAPLGLICFWGSLCHLHEAAGLLNQAYLHWFPTNSQTIFDGMSTGAVILADFLGVAIFGFAAYFLLAFSAGVVFGTPAGTAVKGRRVMITRQGHRAKRPVRRSCFVHSAIRSMSRHAD